MKLWRSNISKMSDSQLVWLYAETRGKEYFGELYLRYLPLVYGLCLKSHQNRETAKNTVRQLFEKLPERLSADAEMMGEFRDWLYEKVEAHLAEPEPDTQEKAGSGLSYAAIELLDRLKDGDAAALEVMEVNPEQMTKPQRECLRLFLKERKSFADIAEETGYLTDNVKDYVMKGLEVVSELQTDVKKR